MSAKHLARLSYEKSCEQLQEMGAIAEGAIPLLPDRSPQHDDDDLSSGFRLFRTWLGSGEPVCRAGECTLLGGGLAPGARQSAGAFAG
jgi:hypothetical protein